MSLTTATLLYNLTLFSFCVVTVFGFVRALPEHRSPGRYMIGLIALAGLALVIAFVLSLSFDGLNPLRTARLLCFGWFVYLPVFSLVCAWRTRNRITQLLAATVVTVTAAIVVFAFQIEPFRLEVTEFEIPSSKVTRPMKICLLADFQTDKFEDYERSSLERLMDERPDLILMAGDYLQADTQADWEVLRDQMKNFLDEKEFKAPLGVYGVGGNTDFQRWPEIFTGLDVVTFQETRSECGGHFHVTGLSIEDSFDPEMSVCRKIAGSKTSDPFHIVLGHAPDFALSENVDADLLVAGHTHGGQVRLPIIGPLVTFSAVPRSWAAGMTKIDAEKWLVVSRGVGMERRDAPRLRFLCRPQLVVINVVPQS